MSRQGNTVKYTFKCLNLLGNIPQKKSKQGGLRIAIGYFMKITPVIFRFVITVLYTLKHMQQICVKK